MNNSTITPDVTSTDFGTPTDLVFDDEPLDYLLGDQKPAVPAPADIVASFSRSASTSRRLTDAVATVLARSPKAIETIEDLEAASRCLRSAIDSDPSADGRVLSSFWCALGRIENRRSNVSVAEHCFRTALSFESNTADGNSSDRIIANPAWGHLIDLFASTGRTPEANALRNRVKFESLMKSRRENDYHQIRTLALDMFQSGQYADAEKAYLYLLERGFEPGSTHCHLARVYLITDREADARREVEQARAAQTAPPDYLRVRIQFLGTLLAMLSGENWNNCVVEFKKALATPGAHLEWAMQPVIDHFKPRLAPYLIDLLAAMLAAACQQSKLSELHNNALWKEICGEVTQVGGLSTVTDEKPVRSIAIKIRVMPAVSLSDDCPTDSKQ